VARGPLFSAAVRRNARRQAMCRECSRKLARVRGCCLLCARITGLLPPTAHAVHELTRRAIQVPAEHLAPRPPLARVYEGVEFEICWDGA
jgi:hypothetical protein